ncbi:hypothetical protein ONS95_012900 [Cadophora gregata]|uniref:uncharacterized protein n=1 Tax=Cadophora gregata TaxID=51156 RepID=UPI0026DBA54E|nr:uncharacterized protein ONS95_012900 [Cadophora gregata]KAK0101116.1 hypothetical protein ONS96_006343 [Cadophora gregata f. sp. sojae]KAK0115851.1 hypothetical protein ONS95_012900 [Cadophora gregata]
MLLVRRLSASGSLQTTELIEATNSDSAQVHEDNVERNEEKSHSHGSCGQEALIFDAADGEEFENSLRQRQRRAVYESISRLALFPLWVTSSPTRTTCHEMRKGSDIQTYSPSPARTGFVNVPSFMMQTPSSLGPRSGFESVAEVEEVIRLGNLFKTEMHSHLPRRNVGTTAARLERVFMATIGIYAHLLFVTEHSVKQSLD